MKKTAEQDRQVKNVVQFLLYYFFEYLLFRLLNEDESVAKMYFEFNFIYLVEGRTNLIVFVNVS